MIYLKRIIILAIVGAMLVSFTACKDEERFVFKKQGLYCVTEENTGVSFNASFGEIQNSFSFTAPSAINGLKAVSNGKGGYELDYGGISLSVGSFAIETAKNFLEAMELLETAGEYENGVITATVDGLYAKGILKNNCISELDFTDGMHNRKYKITTEATTWKAAQKQG